MGKNSDGEGQEDTQNEASQTSGHKKPPFKNWGAFARAKAPLLFLFQIVPFATFLNGVAQGARMIFYWH